MPLGETLEVWELTLTNHALRPLELSIFSLVEFCLWDAQTTPPISSATIQPERWKWKTGVIYHKTEYRERRNHFAYFACSEPLAGFDTSPRGLLGPLPRL